eukprot:TRINITY_DN6229_c1_g1_i1.p1 TRINITY_DN6229_c1_g1~~TRINITY_DN6229_c1_g1_i1.p1  ORF type:complete len:454 (+),score=67.94 TRINITY_DN6229_c1_g1_i1:85-1446(+)
MAFFASRLLHSRSAVALLLLHAFCGAHGKLHQGTLTLGGSRTALAANEEGVADRWHFLGKFGYAIGTGRYEIRLKLQGEDAEEAPAPDLDVFLDEEWPRAASLPPCRRAAELPARKSHPLLEVGRDGEWGPWNGGALYQNVRPHIWYFALSDCRDRYGMSNFNETNYAIDYEIRWRQFDDSELSLEMRYMPTATAVALAILTALFVRFAKKGQRMQRGLGQLHPMVYALGLAMALQWASQALHLCHLWAYSRDGVGHVVTDMLAEVLFMLSQVASASFLIAIAQGYTLVRSKLDEVELLGPVVSVVALLHVTLVAIGKLQGEASCKYHENEGLVGWILLSIRISLFAWFRTGVQNLRSVSGFKLQSFLKRFELAGSAYFLAFPILFLIVQVLAPYLQHPILQSGLLIMQTSSWFWLADLFVTRGSFFEVSELSSSLLPGGAGGASPASFKKEA